MTRAEAIDPQLGRDLPSTVQGRAHRVLVVDGQQLAYGTAACLAVDLEAVEARHAG